MQEFAIASQGLPMDWNRLRTIVFGSATLAATHTAAAQARYLGEVRLGAASVFSGAIPIPAASFGAAGSVDLIVTDKWVLRLGAVATGPLAYNERTICIETGCWDGSQHASQLATVTLDAVVPLKGPFERNKIVLSIGKYRANPAVTEPFGGWITEPRSDMAIGAGIERDFWGERPRLSFGLRALQYRGLYGDHAWGFLLTLSPIFRRD